MQVSERIMFKWAQRKDRLFITADVIAPFDIKVDFGDDTVTIAGKKKHGTPAAEDFSVKLSLFKPIDGPKSSFKVSGNSIQVLCMKKEAGKFWERLVQEPIRATKNWLSCDWQLWKDEDEEDPKENVNFGGYGDLGNLGNLPGGEDDNDDDDDDEKEPPKADLGDLDQPPKAEAAPAPAAPAETKTETKAV